MAEREKVLSGLEHCRRGPIGCQQGCPYKSDFGCRSQLTADALELLKEQEPVPIQKRISVNMWYWCCGFCGVAITEGDKFCRMCGRAVKWDEVD